APTNAGSYGVMASVASDGNYNAAATGVVPFEIARIPLTVTALDSSVTFGEEAADTGVTYSGFLDGEGVDDLKGTLGYIYKSIAGDYYVAGDVDYGKTGTYVITPFGYTADNYEITYVNGSLTVNVASETPELTADNIAYEGVAYNHMTLDAQSTGDVTYSFYTATEITEAAYNALADGSRATYTTDEGTEYYQVTETSNVPVSVGDYGVVAHVAADENYTASTSNFAPFTISKASLTITANDCEVSYLDPAANAGVTFSGFVNGEESDAGTLLSGSVVYAYVDGDNVPYTAGSDAGDYTIDISASTLSADNYEITYVNGTLTVLPIANHVTVTAQSIDYDGEAYDSDSSRLVTTTSGSGTVSYSYYEEITSDEYAALGATDKVGVRTVTDGSDTAYYSPISGAPTDPGNYAVVATVASDGNYNEAGSEPAVFTIRPIITYDYNDDETLPASGDTLYTIVEYGATVTADTLSAAAPSREYYTFTGWADAAGNAVTSIASVTANTTLYAQWKETVAPNGTITVNDRDSWSYLVSPIAFDYLYSTAKTAVIEAEDDGIVYTSDMTHTTEAIQTGVVNSGIDTIYYHVSSSSSSDDVTTYTSDEIKAQDDSFWSTYSDGVVLSGEMYHVVYAKITDRAGNVTYISTDGLDIHTEGRTNATLYPDDDTTETEDGGSLTTEVEVEENSSNAVVKITEQDSSADATFTVADGFGREAAVTTLDDKEIYLSSTDKAVLTLRIQDVDSEDDDFISEEELVEAYVAETEADDVIGAYVDISMYLSVNDGEEEKLVNTNTNDVSINLGVPDSLQGMGSYEIVRVHDGEVAALDTTYNSSAQTLNFTTNKFSTYAIVYVPADSSSDDESSDGDSGGQSSSGTSDSDDDDDSEYLNKTNSSGVSGQDIVDALGVDPETASKILDMMDEYGVSLDTLLLTEDAITSQTNDSDAKGTDFSKLKARAIKCKKHSMVLKWSKQTGADGYDIYGNYCNLKGKVYKKVYIKSVGKNVSKLKLKKLKKGRYYKYVVRAYKIINGKKYTIAASVTIHSTTKGSKYGVAKAVKIKKVGKKKKKTTKVTLKAGKKAKIKAVEVRMFKNKKIKPHRKICYESSDTSIATVTKKGKIIAKKKGKCKIWVYAQNGVFKTINVTVK
ncbi:MAG: Ig-like domain-containing protein, partial [Eubacterium sp.]|nr:Ig-like domain-containing protein [Eubacterium sp.]